MREQAGEQAGERRLAAAGAPEHAQLRARRQREGEFVQHLLLRPVGEGDAIEHDQEHDGPDRGV